MLSREKLEYASTVGYGHQLRELNDDLSSVCDYLRSANVGHVVVLSMRLRTDSLRFYVHGIWQRKSLSISQRPEYLRPTITSAHGVTYESAHSDNLASCELLVDQ